MMGAQHGYWNYYKGQLHQREARPSDNPLRALALAVVLQCQHDARGNDKDALRWLTSEGADYWLPIAELTPEALQKVWPVKVGGKVRMPGRG